MPYVRSYPKMKVTEHFSVWEFRQFAKHGFEVTAYPSEWVGTRLLSLCMALETIRLEFGGKPIEIISGYRSPAYNKHVKGKRLSQHMQGRAADFVVHGVTPQVVHDKVLRLYKDGFLRIGGLGNYPGFTHVDVRPTIRLARWEGTRTNV
jgi:uncharacterized protein YcbK (DUF882 family)